MNIKLLLAFFILSGELAVRAADVPAAPPATTATVAPVTSPALTLTDTPPEVQKAIKLQLGDGTINKLDKASDHDGVTYAIEATAKDGHSRVFTVGEDGTLESIEVTLDQTPTAVQPTIRAQLGRGTLHSIDKVIDEYNVTYSVELTAKNGSDFNFVVATDGSMRSFEMSLEEIPVKVQSTIKAFLGDAKLESIDKTFDDDGVSYAVETITKTGQNRSFVVGDDGNLSDIEIELADAPVVIQQVIKQQLGQGKLKSLDKSIGDDGTTYDVEITNPDGHDHGFNLATNGTVLSTEVALAETPAVVQSAIKNEAGLVRIESIDKDLNTGGLPTYNITLINLAGHERDFTVATNGALLSRQALLENIAPTPRTTILAQIGYGRIIRIEKAVSPVNGLYSYSVEGSKNGRPFNFIVGGDGKFLGLDN